MDKDISAFDAYRENHPEQHKDEWSEKQSELFPDDNQVNHPAHYQSFNNNLNIECIDAMRAAFGDEAVTDFCICNAFKYIWRHQSKNGKTDISKAVWYLNKYLELNK